MNIPLPVGASTLPPLYERWIRQMLQAPLPEETEATCLDCAMCVTKEVHRTESDTLFNVRTKCCTYFPSIPNFLAGKILLDQDPSFSAGRSRFLAQMLAFTVSTPFGVSAPPAESARYGLWMKGFGQDLDLRCPYYMEKEGGLCGIWKYRNAKCSTWFCKHVRGQTGLHFWRVLKDLIRHLEEKLSIWCIHHLEAGNHLFRRLFPLSDVNLETFQQQQRFHYNLAQTRNPEKRAWMEQAWGKWLDRERSFFEECARLVDELAWPEIVNVAGHETERLATVVQDAYAHLTTGDLPDSLVAAGFKSTPISETHVRVWGYSYYDPLDLPKSILNSLTYFDGSPVQNVLDRMEREKGMRFSEEWIRKLYDFGILVVR
jgi:hypothetical protein